MASLKVSFNFTFLDFTFYFILDMTNIKFLFPNCVYISKNTHESYNLKGVYSIKGFL